MSVGEVLELWRYPVESMRGEAMSATRVGPASVLGDRAHALMHELKDEVRPLTARQAPRLLAWRADYLFAPGATLRGAPPAATVIGPDGRSHRWGDPLLRRLLAEEAAATT